MTDLLWYRFVNSGCEEGLQSIEAVRKQANRDILVWFETRSKFQETTDLAFLGTTSPENRRTTVYFIMCFEIGALRTGTVSLGIEEANNWRRKLKCKASENRRRVSSHIKSSVLRILRSAERERKHATRFSTLSIRISQLT